MYTREIRSNKHLPTCVVCARSSRRSAVLIVSSRSGTRKEKNRKEKKKQKNSKNVDTEKEERSKK